MSNMKRCISLLLVLGILLGVLAPAAKAAPAEETAIVDTGDVTVEGSNGFGSLLAQEVAENQQEAKMENEDYLGGYSVTDLEIVDNVATVTYASLEEAQLVVALYTEDGMQLLTSATATVTPDAIEATVTFEDEMPDYFMASTYLLDEYDYSPLCAAYETAMYTKEMQELLDSTVDDYDPEKVLNLDDDDTTNFAVYADSTIVIEPAEGVNTVASIDDENATYVIKNADEQMTSLSEGDVFVYTYGVNEILIVKVAGITVDGTTVTIIGDDIQMTDVFDVVKVETIGNTEDFIIDESGADDGITYLGHKNNGDVSICAEGDFEQGTELKFGFDDVELGNGVKLSGGLASTLKLKLNFYVTWTYQEVIVSLNFGGNFDISVSGKCDWCRIKMPVFTLPVTWGMYIRFKPAFVVESEAKITFEVSLSQKVGFKYSSHSGFNNISSNPDVDTEFSFEGKIFVGIDFGPEIKVVGGYLLNLRASMIAGVEITGKLSGTTIGESEPDRYMHQCELCIDGDISFRLKITPSLVFLNSEKLKLELDLCDTTVHFLNFYYSDDLDRFGIGICPNRSYLITFQTTTREGEAVPGAIIEINGVSDSLTANDAGVATCYLAPGEYSATATSGDMYCTKSFYIEQPTKIIISLILDANGDGMDDETGESIEAGNDINFGDILGELKSEDITDYGDNNAGKVPFLDGDGTETNPYQVFNAEQLNAVRKAMDAHYIQTADIDLNGQEWTPIGHIPLSGDSSYFSGSYDGNGFKISNLSITQTSENRAIGFFGANKGTLKNITLDNISINIDVGYANDYDAWTLYGSYVGGISGWSTGTVMNCIVNGAINVNNAHLSKIGGIAGMGSCNNCTNYATVTVQGAVRTNKSGSVSCGGLIGNGSSVNASIGYSVNYGDVNVSADAFLYCGGISGEYGQIDNCINYGEIVGTLIENEGYTSSFAGNCNVGGIVGATSSDRNNNCVNFGNVTALKICSKGSCLSGGIAGYIGYYNTGKISNCYNLSEVILAESAAGRIAGRLIPNNTSECYSIDTTTVNGEIPTEVGTTTIHGGSMNENEINNAIKSILAALNIDVAESVRTAHFFREWDTENQIACFDDVLLISQVVEETDTSFQVVEDILAGYNVLEENKNGDSGDAAPNTHICTKLVETRTRTNPAADEKNITWVPYMSSEGNGPIVEISTIPVQKPAVGIEAVYGGEYNTEVIEGSIIKTASFSDLVPGEQYVILAMVSIEVDDPLTSENLLFIDQAAAQKDGSLSFQYIQRTPADISYVVACGASNKDLRDAEITFPKMEADGDLHVVNPIVVYDGKTLTEGKDYIINGTVDYTEAGKYTCRIRGIRNYAGQVECVYVVEEAQLDNPFNDVILGSFYYEPVLWAVENGITSGTSETTFDPSGLCLRAHVVTFLYRTAKSPEPSSTKNPFTDVKAGDFYYKPVLWAVEKGITNGISANKFGSMDVCNRAAVVTFLWRAAGSPEPESTNNPFEDVKDTDFFYKPVLWAVENGITNGVDATHFGPGTDCNRAQVVTFLYRAYN